MNGFPDVDLVDLEGVAAGDMPGSSELINQLGLSPRDVAPLARFERLSEQIQTARDAVFAGRPGGADYRTALRADAEAIISGRPAEQAAQVLAGDAARWATLQATKRARDMSREQLGEVRRRSGEVARGALRGVIQEIEETAAVGWTGRHDKGLAWSARYAADQMVERFGWLHSVARWGNGDRWNGGRQVIPDGRAGGTLMALRHFLDGTVPLTFAQGVEFPDGYLDDLDKKATPLRVDPFSAARAGAAASR